nr:hypothetical protein CFP56_26076 [Quercus suber]
MIHGMCSALSMKEFCEVFGTKQVQFADRRDIMFTGPAETPSVLIASLSALPLPDRNLLLPSELRESLVRLVAVYQRRSQSKRYNKSQVDCTIDRFDLTLPQNNHTSTQSIKTHSIDNMKFAACLSFAFAVLVAATPVDSNDLFARDCRGNLDVCNKRASAPVIGGGCCDGLYCCGIIGSNNLTTWMFSDSHHSTAASSLLSHSSSSRMVRLISPDVVVSQEHTASSVMHCQPTSKQRCRSSEAIHRHEMMAADCRYYRTMDELQRKPRRRCRRHRNRKAEYVDELEKEVARLRRLRTEAQSERLAIEQQNDTIKELLGQHSLNARLDSMSFAGANIIAEEDLSDYWNRGAVLDVRYDPEISHERTFLDFQMQDVVQTATNTSTSETSMGPQRLENSVAPVKGDTAAALDFILALEWPCSGHSTHEGLRIESSTCVIPDLGMEGHAFSTTNAVFQSALPIGQDRSKQAPAQPLGNNLPHGQNQQKWHDNLLKQRDRLVKLSERLPLDDEQLTPAQAYSAIRENVPSDDWLIPVLNALIVSLCRLAQCGGFGTVL